MRKLRLIDRRGLSPIFATVLLAAIVIVFGSFAYYYSNNIVTTTTNDYSKAVSSSQQSISERLSIENVDTSQSGKLIIYIINSGSASNIKISALTLYDSSKNIKHVYSSTDSPKTITELQDINLPQPTLQSLNSGKEAFFTVTLGGQTVVSGDTFQLITQSGSSFYYVF